MRSAILPSRASTATLAVLALALTACNAPSRLANVGQAPPLTTIEDPQALPGYQPVRLPMPTPQVVERNANSLWRSGARAFFKDQRASQIGDILTVVINIEDQARINNSTTRSRDNSEGAGLPAFLGYEQSLNKILPEAVRPDNLVEFNSTTSNSGTGAITRAESIELQVAALITQVLPNGNLVLQGKQEVRVNYEVRELQITGVIRPEDISSANTISYEKIAEARISYGGRGQITDFQQPRYGQQIFDIIFPF